jgi:phosphatidylserine/phosphatidylglycerophosphate/cardiolipin synthase-like enzyme
MQPPRDHWNPALVILDEAHLFAPEQGKAESTAAVIDIATRGRKRGLALVAATQRLSKLHKDVGAELLNKLIGRTGLDVDVRRAGDELGMSARYAMSSLRDLHPGEFFAFGPALTRIVTKLQIGQVQTTHPKVGNRLSIRTPSPSRKVLGIESAHSTIRVAAYSFTSKPIAQALLADARRGVDVRVVVDKSNATARYTAATFLANEGVPLRVDYRYAIMHDKFMVVDGQTVEEGSFNYTAVVEAKNAENVLVLHDPVVAQRYGEEWDRLWAESEEMKPRY